MPPCRSLTMKLPITMGSEGFRFGKEVAQGPLSLLSAYILSSLYKHAFAVFLIVGVFCWCCCCFCFCLKIQIGSDKVITAFHTGCIPCSYLSTYSYSSGPVIEILFCFFPSRWSKRRTIAWTSEALPEIIPHLLKILACEAILVSECVCVCVCVCICLAIWAGGNKGNALNF